jgi:hypothetical protein
VERTLDDELDGCARPLLLAQLSRARELRPDDVRLVQRLRAAGFDVETLVLDEQPAWWFSRGEGRGGDLLTEPIADWLVRRLHGRPA